MTSWTAFYEHMDKRASSALLCCVIDHVKDELPRRAVDLGCARRKSGGL